MSRTLRLFLTAAVVSLTAATSPAQAADVDAGATVAAAGQSLKGWLLDTVRDADAPPPVRRVAQDALAEGLTDRDAPAVLALIGDWEAPVDTRVWAARVAGEQRLPGAAEALRSAASDDLFAIRTQAHRSLAWLQGVGTACLAGTC